MISLFRRKQNGAPQELLGPAAKLMSSSVKIDFDFDAFAGKHVFNRVSRKSEYGFYYGPYSYLFRYPKWGVINELGFRYPGSINEVRAEYPNHAVVAVFGGSTGFSILVPDNDAWHSRLEKLLNADRQLLAALGKDGFRVVNLSQPGNVLMCQIMNFVQYCTDLRPDIVVSHDGWNDLMYGQISDPLLLSRYKMTYVDVLEAWGRKLHDGEGEAIDFDYSEDQSANFRPVQAKNGPAKVVDAYRARVRQFARIAAADGALFVNGFQPWVGSKLKLSPEEAGLVDKYRPYYRDLYRGIPALYDLVRKAIAAEGDVSNTVDLTPAFAQLDQGVQHFGDVCHTTAAGDAVLADTYYKIIRDKVLQVK